MEHYFQDMTAQFELNDAATPLKSWNSKSTPVEESDDKDCSGGFDCNICLDTVQDPVVTFCGHLYCWPCIYKWIHTEKPDHQEPECPVCKAGVTEKTLIPLYGPGVSTKSSDEKAPNFGTVIPQRPQTPKCTSSLHSAQQLHQRGSPQLQQQVHPYPGGYMAAPMLNFGGTSTNLPQPMVGMFGEMVYSRIFGDSETTLYTYPNSYNVASTGSPRLRRHIMEVDRSLSRICFFLLCCMVLCLLLF